MNTPGECFWFDLDVEIMEKVYEDIKNQFAK